MAKTSKTVPHKEATSLSKPSDDGAVAEPPHYSVNKSKGQGGPPFRPLFHTMTYGRNRYSLRDGEINKDVTHRIGTGWIKWRLGFGVFCEKKMSPILKAKFYRSVVRPAMLYGVECWPVKNYHIQRMKVAELRMLRWMCGHSMIDKIRNEDTRKTVGMAPIYDKMREARLRWFGHVQRRSLDVPVRRCERLVVVGTRRGRGRPKKYWGEAIR
uniref:Uncharacterized protein LOC104210926 n=1 Tax=Nicotiana sylvestris TaxID=4096 RepID=A0A1U7UZN4_NICSY|nr:PREDICTED: uncharacterized protein LOC104210926 [Nicotiana sylvestris]